jgi:uncharacterized protein YndB with AHSA1/START domain
MNAYGTIVAADTVRIERLLPGPVERIWSWLTESDKRRLWLAAGDMQFLPGSALELVFRNSELTENDVPPPSKYAGMAGPATLSVTVVACDPNRRLVLLWGAGADASEVTFDLAPKGDKVLLTVTHRRIPDREEMLSISSGWHTHLDILAARLEGREPAGFWATHTRLEAEYQRIVPAA